MQSDNQQPYMMQPYMVDSNADQNRDLDRVDLDQVAVDRRVAYREAYLRFVQGDGPRPRRAILPNAELRHQIRVAVDDEDAWYANR
jgi:hypothetical protein